MANKRIFYAAKKAGMGPVGSAQVKGVNDPTDIAQADKGKFRQLHGLQSVGITTTFNLEQTFELGMLQIYENIEGIPDISVDIEKVLDGYCPAYVLATSINGDGELSTTDADNKATAATLIGRSKAQCDFALNIYKDTSEIAANVIDNGGSDGAAWYKDQPEISVMMSGMFVNSVSYTVGIDGYATESVSLVGQDKVFHATEIANGVPAMALWSATDFITREEDPLAFTQGSGGVNRREDVLYVYPGNDTAGGDRHTRGYRDVNGAVSGLGTVLPRQIPGVSTSGTVERDNGSFKVHVQSITCSTDFGREDIFELGRRGRYHRFVPFPTEATCEITCISTSGDLINVTEEGFIDPSNTSNIQNETIRLHLREGLLVDMGKKNKLSSVNVTGGDAGGGNEEITYSYQNFNDFTVFHPQDPLAVAYSGATGDKDRNTGSNGSDTAATTAYYQGIKEHFQTSKFTLRDGRHGDAGTAHASV